MTKIVAFIENRNKAVIALVAASLTWGQLVVDSKPAAIDANEWMLLGWLLAGVVGVERVTNRTSHAGE